MEVIPFAKVGLSLDEFKEYQNHNPEPFKLIGLNIEPYTPLNTSAEVREIAVEDKKEVDLVLQKLLKELDTPKSLYYFTSKLNKVFSNEKKALLIETLWDIILSDGKEHEYESNLIRRLAGLLYISDVNCGNAKKRALAKL